MAKKLIIISTIIIVVLSGTGGYLGLRIWDPLWSPFRPEPEDVMEEMTKKMGELKTLQADLRTEAKIFDGEVRIKQDVTDSQNPKFALNFKAALETEEIQLSLGGEYKTIGGDSYLKLTTLPVLPLLDLYFQTMGINISEIKNQWVKLNPYAKIFGVGGIREMEAIKQLIFGRKFYLIEEELEDEIIGENRAYHYIISLNREEIKNVILELELLPTQLRSLLSEEGLFGDEKTGEWLGDIWIGKEDKYLYKFKGKNEILNIRININFSDFNQPLEISPPEEFESLEEIFRDFAPL